MPASRGPGIEICPTKKPAVRVCSLSHYHADVSERRLRLSPAGLSLASPVATAAKTHQRHHDSRARENRFGARPAIRCSPMSDEPTSPKLQVQIDEDVAQGVYSNLVLLNHTENEFVLDFAFIQPSNGRAKVRSRVISSPRHTKRLLQALQKNLERYEERFGTIETGSDDDTMFH